MPLIDIITSDLRCPTDHFAKDSSEQALTAQLGEAFPKLICDNAAQLGLDPGETPQEGVQVDFGAYHPRAVNKVDLWIIVSFTEQKPPPGEVQSIKATLVNLLLGWLTEKDFDLESLSFALDIVWLSSHGVLRMGPTHVDW